MRAPLRLSCQEQLLPGATLVEKWEAAQRMGFDAIELRGRGDGQFARRLPELERAAALGVPMPTVCVEMDHFVGDFDPDRRRDALRQMREQLTTIAAIGGRLAMTPASYGMFSRRLPPFEPPRSEEEDHEVLVDAFGQLAEHAEAEGVLIVLEPLNRYEDHMVNTLAQAVALCEAVGSPALRIAADTYHMNIEEADIPAAILAAAPYLAHVQVSDSNRLEPGSGHLDWPLVLAALEAAGYEHELAYECRLSGPAEQVLPRSVSFLRRMAA
jgi:sugar phosphate isomerase/epimerase